MSFYTIDAFTSIYFVLTSSKYIDKSLTSQKDFESLRDTWLATDVQLGGFHHEAKTNVINPKFLEQIEKNDTNWFSNENIEVILKINNSAKEYFLRKEILPNKKLLEQNDEYFTISTIVSYDDEILRVVKSWLPYIKIVSPQYLQTKLDNILIEYINL